MKQITADQLLLDISNHAMTVRADAGLYRHLVFKQPTNSWNMWFEIVTWPRSLTINGDMGTWSFSRVDDMFTFFRSSGQLKINAHYWAEKITSESRFGGPSRQFQAEIFKANVLASLDGYGLSNDLKAEIVQALEDEVFNEENEATARQALANFKHGDFELSDSWEINGNDYTYHYLWCLYAIVWAIQQYDAIKTTPELALKAGEPGGGG